MLKTIAMTGVKSNRGSLLVVAWTATLLVSVLPDILLRELAGGLPAWLYWAKSA